MADDGAGENLESQVMTLLRSRRYDPSILPKLEEFVDYQVSHQFCDSSTNLAVLKLYQFYPDKYNPSTVSKILIKALMNLPSTDFLCALYLIPDRKQVDEPIPVITQLQALLETGHFKDFWETSGTCADLLASVPGSIDAVREFMVSVIGRTYKSIDKSTLCELLNLDSPGVDEIIAKQKWEQSEGVIDLPSNEENQPRPPTVDEQLNFRQVASKML